MKKENKIKYLLIPLFVLGLFFVLKPVKAFTEEDLDFYYPLLNDCSSFINSDFDLTENSPSFSTSIFGGGLDNDGSENASFETVRCGISDLSVFSGENRDRFSLQASEDFSFSVWFQRETTNNPSVEATLFANGYTDWGHYKLVIDSSDKLAFVFHGTSSSNSYVYWRANDSIDSSQLNNIIVLGTINNLTNTFKMYVNGVEVSGTVNGSTNYWDNTPYNPNSSIFNIAYSHYTQYGLNGVIGDFAKFNKILTTDEIDEIQENSITDILSGESSNIFNINFLTDFSLLSKHDDFIFNYTYDFCDNYSEVNSAYLKLGVLDENGSTVYFNDIISSGSVFRNSLISPEVCSGVKSYTIKKEDLLLSNLVFVVMYETDDLYMEIYDVLPSFVYGINYISVPFDSYEFDLRFNTATSTRLFFNYDFTGLDYQDSTVCLFDLYTSSTTDFCYNVFSPKSSGYVDLPVPFSPVSYNAYFKSSISGHYVSPVISIRFFDDYLTVPDELKDDDDFKAFDGFLKFLSSYFNGLITPLKRLFPFNFISVLSVSWDGAIINDKTAIPIININESDNLYLELPVGDIEIFGNEFFTRDDKLSVFFAYVKVFITFLLSAFYFFILYNFGVMLYNKITGDNVGMLNSSSFSFKKRKQKVYAKAVIIKNKKNIKIRNNNP